MTHLQLRDDNDSIENEVVLAQVMAVATSFINSIIPWRTIQTHFLRVFSSHLTFAAVSISLPYVFRNIKA
jgi:hypothetical protein